MTRKEKLALRQHQSTRQLMGMQGIASHGITTSNSELVFFLIRPDNLSVLSSEGIRARVTALANLLRAEPAVELLVVDSRESFQRNKEFYQKRLEEETTPAIRKLLIEDMRHLDAKTYVILSFGSCLIGALVLGLWCNTGTPILMYIAAIFLGSGYAVGTTYGPMITTKLFGTKDYERIIPIVFGMRCIGLGVGIWIVPAIADATQNWANGCWAALVMLIAGAVMGYLAIVLSPAKEKV